MPTPSPLHKAADTLDAARESTRWTLALLAPYLLAALALGWRLAYWLQFQGPDTAAKAWVLGLAGGVALWLLRAPKVALGLVLVALVDAGVRML